MKHLHLGTLLLITWITLTAAHAQDNYEIQVYSTEMDAPGTTTLELHSNFTVEGRATVRDGVAPTHHAMHETLEVAHGFTDWFETGIYVFSTIQPDGGWQFVGSHIRPRLTAPESWHLPVGLSLGQEIGYQRRQFADNTWTYELQPILDKKIGRWYMGFNPIFERALHGVDSNAGWQFSPSAKVSYDFTKKIAGGIEYYSSLGPTTEFLPLGRQAHQFFPSIDLDISPKWELNFGVGFDPNRHSDHVIVKCIVGRRFNWGRHTGSPEPAPERDR
jgi:hypothetical protein